MFFVPGARRVVESALSNSAVRIMKGIQDGSLTTAEGKALEAELTRIAILLARAGRDGYTERELEVLLGAASGLGRAVHAQRTNAAGRNAWYDNTRFEDLGVHGKGAAIGAALANLKQRTAAGARLGLINPIELAILARRIEALEAKVRAQGAIDEDELASDLAEVSSISRDVCVFTHDPL